MVQLGRGLVEDVRGNGLGAEALIALTNRDDGCSLQHTWASSTRDGPLKPSRKTPPRISSGATVMVTARQGTGQSPRIANRS